MPELLPETQDPVAEAERAVRNYAGWHIAPNRADTDTFRSDGGTVLILRSLHVTAVESVTINGEPVTGFEWYEHGTLHCAAGWPVGKVTVKFSHGYELAEVADVSGVVQSLITRGGAGGNYVQVGQVRVATDASGVPLGVSLTKADKARLDRYRLPPRP